jgi:hypothetical protein
MRNAPPARRPPARARNATHVYCLVAAKAAPGVKGAPAGLAGTGAVRLLEAGRGRWLVVADAPLAVYSADAVNARLADLGWVGERAMEHEEVIEHFAARGTVVPMKLFTLFSSDARAVADVKARRDLPRLLAALEGREEYGLRVSVDPVSLRKAAAGRAKAPAGLSEGTGFLVRRQKEQRSVQDARAEARRGAELVFEALAPLAADSRRRPPADVEGATLLLDAAFLVERRRAREFAATAREQAERADAGALRVVLTGPWPPYNFLSPPPKAAGRRPRP